MVKISGYVIGCSALEIDETQREIVLELCITGQTNLKIKLQADKLDLNYADFHKLFDDKKIEIIMKPISD